MRYAVEEADEVIIDGGEVTVCWCFVKVCVCVGVAIVWGWKVGPDVEVGDVRA